MIFVKYLLFAIASILASIIGVFVVSFAIVFGGPNNRLPDWARWFDNDREPFGDIARYPAINTATGLRKLWLRYLWLAWRNPANNLGAVLGVARPKNSEIEIYGNPNTSDQGEAGVKFTALKCLDCGSVVAFEIYIVLAYYATRCVRIRLGWKLYDNPARLVHVINPVMPFTGKY